MDRFTAQIVKPMASGVDATASRGIAVASGVGAHAKGAWVAVGSCESSRNAFILTLESEDTGTDFLVDVSCGSGQVLVADLFFSSGVAAGSGRVAQFFIPFSPAGAILVRCQSSAGTKTIYATTHSIQFHRPLFGVSNTYGANTGDTGGVGVDPGGTINTKGAWSEIVSAASMTRAAKGFWLCFGARANAAMTTASWLVDIGVGAGGVESAILADTPLHVYGTTSLITPGNSIFIPMPIAAGTRISARAQCSINDATDRLIDVIVYTVS